MRRCILLLLLLAFAPLSQSTLNAQTATPVVVDRQADPGHAAYTLPPEKMKLAVGLFRTRTLLHFAGAGWGILQLVLLLAFAVPARLRDLALRATQSRWGQGFLFTLLLLLLLTVLDLPLGIYGHHLGLAYGLSVQGWASWFADLAKGFGIEWGSTGLAVMLLFWVIRKSPRHWWFWFWIPAMLAVIFGVFISPVLIDPLFDHFELLSAHDPTLVARLEQVVARGPLHIPPDRMFLMRASAKYTGLNAYVTGIGPSKRVVVWDTSIAKGTPEEIQFIFGHEMGHYVLNHIYLGLLFAGALVLAGFWVGFHIVQWLLRTYGARWQLESQNDWAALVVFMLVLSALTFVTEPIANGFSRWEEHAADVYGQEAMHGILADPQAVGVRSFQVLGENSLEDPRRHPFVEWWSYSHPAIWERSAFAASYNPWAPGQKPKYFTH
ncbi:M48 family metallopeptidase [Granulicella arctica]|uniref:M48 family metallopeptidase n=1 Tax=Granulicella arctica TaxID=940613 RepID=UPI0021DFB81C|nr:M48 family metallopeptidase [Granulicella arctica]